MFTFFRISTIAVLLLAASSICTAADDDRRLSATIVSGAVYPPGRWMAINAKLSNFSAAQIAGTVTVKPTQFDGMLRVQRDVVVPGKSIVTLEMLGRFADQEAMTKKKIPDLATVTWRKQDGGNPLDEPLNGLSDAAITRGGHDSTQVPGAILVWISARHDNRDRVDATELAPLLSTRTAYSFDAANIDAADFPRHSEALDAMRLIAIDPAALDDLDVAQQQAILAAVKAGATLLLTQPPAPGDGAWLARYFPLDFIGNHRPKMIEPDKYESMPLLKQAPIGICVARSGTVTTAADSSGVLAAYRPLGFGRIAMTAFDVNDLSPTPEAAKMWGDLIGIDRRVFHDPAAPSEAPAAAAMLPTLIGASAPPWRLAAGVVGGYCAIIAILLLAAGPVRRPIAMAGCVGVSVVLTGALLGFTSIKSRGQPLMVGRVTTLDVAGGESMQTDLITFYGQDRSDLTFDLQGNALPSPVVANDALLSLWPKHVAQIKSSSGKLETVWQIRRSLPAAATLNAAVKFGPDGATLETQNTFDQPLQSPRLIVGGDVVPLPPIPTGNAEQTIGPRNPAGVFTDSGALLADEQSQLRAALIEKVFMPSKGAASYSFGRPKAGPVLSGFISTESAARLTQSSDVREQTVLRAPLAVQATAVGTDVQIDPAFTTIHGGAVSSLPYSPATDTWNEGNLTGSWEVGIAAQREIGRLRPTRMKLGLDISATGVHIFVKRGQCSGGRVRENGGGTVIADLSASGRKDATIDLTDADFDANGWIWLRLEVQPAATEGFLGDSAGSTWHVRQFDATLYGKIDGPPQADIATWALPEPTQPRTAAPKKPAQKN